MTRIRALAMALLTVPLPMLPAFDPHVASEHDGPDTFLYGAILGGLLPLP